MNPDQDDRQINILPLRETAAADAVKRAGMFSRRGNIALGFVVSFLVALLVIRWFVGLVSKHGFAPFAWYRIAAGVAALIWLGMR